jgi:predicted phage tail protein
LRRRIVAAGYLHRERIMIVETKSGGSGNVLLAFILGAVLVAVAVVGFFMWDNYKSGGAHPPPSGINLTVKK